MPHGFTAIAAHAYTDRCAVAQTVFLPCFLAVMALSERIYNNKKEVISMTSYALPLGLEPRTP